MEKKAEYVNQAVLECMKLYLIKSITSDNGNEFSSLSKIEGLDVYFSHAYSSYERGTNENFNGLLREFIPKGASLKEPNQNLLEDYTKAINERPRRIHGYSRQKSCLSSLKQLERYSLNQRNNFVALDLTIRDFYFNYQHLKNYHLDWPVIYPMNLSLMYQIF